VEDLEVTRIDRDGARTLVDLVVREVPVTIFVDADELVTVLASPSDLEELAVGFLYTSGLIESRGDVGAVRADTRHGAVTVELTGRTIDAERISKRLFTSGCGRGTIFYRAADLVRTGGHRGDLTVKPERILDLMRELHDRSETFRETGGVHSAAVCTTQELLCVREDLGRHNAVDKVLGHALLNGIDLADKILLSSGRISSEIVLKVRKTTLPILASRSAPTDQAVKHAREAGLTLIGFARGHRMNVYSGTERLDSRPVRERA
jgi:FdhD protein